MENKKGKPLSKRVFLSLTIIWMVVIFLFSSRPGDVSQEDSYKVGTLICRIFVPGFDEFSDTEKIDMAKGIDYGVRKTAHASEYAVLGIFIFGALDMVRRKRIFLSWHVGTLYAMIDEFHQLFVSGRSGQITDVLIDSAGCMAGILISALIAYILAGKKSRPSFYTG